MAKRSEGVPFEQLDQDGAIRDTASKVDGDTRRAFLQKAAVFTGTGTGAGAAIGALGSLGVASGMTSSSGTTKDIDILNYALALEYLESDFYAEAVSKGSLSGELATFAKTVATHEAAHVAGLKKALGSKAISEPSFNFQGATAGSKFAPTSWALENTGTKAYLGQAAAISNPQYLVVAGQILCVEARLGWATSSIARPVIPSTCLRPNPSSPTPTCRRRWEWLTACTSPRRCRLRRSRVRSRGNPA